MDGIDTAASNKTFVIQFDKPFRWQADDFAEKNAFLFSLWKVLVLGVWSEKSACSPFRRCLRRAFGLKRVPCEEAQASHPRRTRSHRVPLSQLCTKYLDGGPTFTNINLLRMSGE